MLRTLRKYKTLITANLNLSDGRVLKPTITIYLNRTKVLGPISTTD